MRQSLIVMALLAAWASAPALAETTSTGEPLKTLMIVGGVAHDYQTLPVQLAERLSANKELQVRVISDLSEITADRLADLDVLIFNCCLDTELSEAQQQAIVSHLRNGKGLVAVHCALWSFQKWPEWRQIIGGLVLTHDPYGPFQVKVVDAGHPITANVPPVFDVNDEPYLAQEWEENNHVVLETVRPHGGRDKPEPMAFTTRYAGGQVFTIMLGHDAKTYEHPAFVTLLANGIRWTAGRTAPATMLSEKERAEGFIPLFDGKSLTGWRYDPKLWKVKDAIIFGNSHPKGLENNSFAITEDAFDDFVLRFSVKFVSGNTGVQFRSIEGPDYTVGGYQADVVPLGWGNLHEQDGRRKLVDGWTGKAEKVMSKEWNDMEVIARGPHIVLKTNGLVTCDWKETDDSRPKVGIVALQLHRGEPMEVQFTNIRIKPLKQVTSAPAVP